LNTDARFKAILVQVLVVASGTFLHTLAYKGMGILPIEFAFHMTSRPSPKMPRDHAPVAYLPHAPGPDKPKQTVRLRICFLIYVRLRRQARPKLKP